MGLFASPSEGSSVTFSCIFPIGLPKEIFAQLIIMTFANLPTFKKKLALIMNYVFAE